MSGSNGSYLLRGITLAVGITAALLTRNLPHLLGAWGVLILLISISPSASAYFRLLLVLIAPIATALAALLFFNWLLSSVAFTTSFVDQHLLPLARVIVLCSLGHWTFLPLPPSDRIAFLRAWGVPNNLVIMTAAAFTLWPLVRQKANEVVVARYARGLVKDLGFISALWQLPFTIRTLLAYSLQSAHSRSVVWTHEDTLYRLKQFEVEKDDRFDRRIWLPFVGGVVWLFLEIFEHAI